MIVFSYKKDVIKCSFVSVSEFCLKLEYVLDQHSLQFGSKVCAWRNTVCIIYIVKDFIMWMMIEYTILCIPTQWDNPLNIVILFDTPYCFS